MKTEIDSLRWLFDAARSKGDGACIVLDLDQTLVRSPTHFGGERWYDALIRRAMEQGVSERDATLAANAQWEAVNVTLEMVPMELSSAGWLDAWQSEGPAMGLTARSPGYARRTKEQLDPLGLKFRGLPGVPDIVDLGDRGRYEYGILFVGPVGDKGTSLELFLDRTGYQPKAVFFADDKPVHIERVKKKLETRGVECVSVLFRSAER